MARSSILSFLFEGNVVSLRVRGARRFLTRYSLPDRIPDNLLKTKPKLAQDRHKKPVALCTL